jgi:hypothetical protein
MSVRVTGGTKCASASVGGDESTTSFAGENPEFANSFSKGQEAHGRREAKAV